MKFFLRFSACCLLIGSSLFAQEKAVTVSGIVVDGPTPTPIAYANVLLKSTEGKTLQGTVTDEKGRFSMAVSSGNYQLEFSLLGFKPHGQPLFVGNLTAFLDIGTIALQPEANALQEVVVSGKPDMEKTDRKIYAIGENLTQAGGSILQAMQTLPGVTVQDGKILLRGNDKVTVLVDGKLTAMTGFGGQTGLDNLPASAIDRIEIVNNPSAKYEANGNAGIVNIIYKKERADGFNGTVGMASGVGALWERKANLPMIDPQYRMTPKINPSLSLNYRKGRFNTYFQGDYLYTETLNKNEFVTRTYEDGSTVAQQTRRNRNTHFTTLKAGFDWNYNDRNTVTFAGLFGSEKIVDHGEEPFYNGDISQMLRLWQFVENELKTTAMVTAGWQHKFDEPGRTLGATANYTFHRENEQYRFVNILPFSTGEDAFKLLSDEKVIDLALDYVNPLRYGRVELGAKFRNREIPTNMRFFPGPDSPIDARAGGRAIYEEIIPAVYGNYVYESPKVEAELGLRAEYINLRYHVDPNHPVYKSDGYDYLQPFPSVRMAYKFDARNKLSVFYNRRVDRPNEVDIRIFPKYDDAEIIKVGNPALRPQFTDSYELAFKRVIDGGWLSLSVYDKSVSGTISRISTTAPGSNLVYAVFQNADESHSIGSEIACSKKWTDWYKMDASANVYHTVFDPFTAQNRYPVDVSFYVEKQQITSGNLKTNHVLRFSKSTSAQLSTAWYAADIIPQGKTGARFSVDLGLKRSVQQGKGEFFLNATDLGNTLVIRKEIVGNGFRYTSKDYYETQVIRLGYRYKF